MSEIIISCYACSTELEKVHEKSIGGYIYQYCSEVCAKTDFTICSACADGVEMSKKDCMYEQYGCCQQYLGGNLQYYCSEQCKCEDTTAFIKSFQKSEKN